MSDTPDNMVLELLRLIRADAAAIRRALHEHGLRLANIEAGLLGVRRDAVADATGAAITSTRLDEVVERLERLERRTGLID